MSAIQGVRCDSCVKTTEGFLPEGWIKVEEKLAGKFGALVRHFCSHACLRVFVETGIVREPAILTESTAETTREAEAAVYSVATKKTGAA